MRFLTEWKAGYRPGMDQVSATCAAWTTMEAIYRRRLDELFPTTISMGSVESTASA